MEGEAVERLVREGRLDPLTIQTYEDELSGLREDMVNWDCGHKCRPIYREAEKRKTGL